MSQQQALPLTLNPFASLDNFIAGDNAQLLEHLKSGLRNALDPLFISGPEGSGKTHLLMGASEYAGAQGLHCSYLPLREGRLHSPELLEGLEQLDVLAIDDLHFIAGIASWEEKLFVLFNRCRSAGCKLIFSANQAAAELAVKLPDLRSRLAWGTQYRIKPLTDQGLEQLLQQQAAQRGLRLQPRVARYLISHCQRDAPHLVQLMEQLDQASLASQRKLTLPFVREHIHH